MIFLNGCITKSINDKMQVIANKVFLGEPRLYFAVTGECANQPVPSLVSLSISMGGLLAAEYLKRNQDTLRNKPGVPKIISLIAFDTPVSQVFFVLLCRYILM